MSRRWLLPALLLLGAIIAAIVWLSAPTNHTTKRQQTATEQTGSSLSTIHWHTGIAQQYKVKSDSSMQMAAATSNRSSIDVQIQCLLDTLTLDTSHEIVVGMKLSDVALEINGSGDADTNRELSTPFRVHFARDGLPLTFDFPAEVSNQNRKILENLIRMFQVSIIASHTWVVHESNGNGSYEAAYRRSGPLQIDKSKRNFTALPESMLTEAVISSTEQLRLSPDHDWIAAMRVDETLQSTSAKSPKMTITNHATLDLHAGLQPPLSADIWRFTAATAAIDETATRITQAVPEISAEEARKQIRLTIPELDKATRGRLALVHRLRDLLRVDASLPAALLEILQTQQLSDRTRADLYLVFEEAGTASAQAALVSVFTDNSSWSFKDIMRAIVAMGGVDKPNNDSIAALWNTALNTVSDGDNQRIASAASFALGSLGNTMKASSHPDYDSLRSSLLNNALSGADIQQRSDFLLAVGNTQDSTLASEIVGQLDDDAPSIRRATALSLGMLDIDQVADTLVSKFQQEENSLVRSAIAESLESWTHPSASAMAMFRETIKSERDQSTRYNVATLLGKNMGKFPENEVVLREMMRSESSKRIRQKIADMLSTGS